MEESAEKRRERLRALRDEASLLAAGSGSDVAGNPVATPPDGVTSNLLLHHPHHRPPPASPRFEFYTDPLAAFSASSHKKKKKLNSYASSASPVFVRPPPSPPSSSLWRANVFNNPTSNCNPVGGFHTPTHSPNPRFQQDPKSDPNSTPPGKFLSPGPPNYNGSYNTAYSNPGPSGYTTGRPGYGSQTAFRSPQPSSAPHHVSGGGGSGGYSTPHRNSGNGSFLANSPWQGVGNGVNSSQGGNSSWGRSPGGGRKSWTPGGSGGRGSQRSHNYFEESAVMNPERFFSRSMLMDPWKDLIPVGVDSVDSRLNSCSVAGSSSQNWLPKSVSEKVTPSYSNSIILSASGPSLADSLADSFADAVDGCA